MNKWLYRFILCLCFIGIGIQAYPFYVQYETKSIQKKEIKQFKDTVTEDRELYEEMKEYNETIYQEKQSGLKDIFSYSHNPFDLSGLKMDTDMIGFVDIDKLDLHVPLYIGASYENLNRGVAVLSQTSMPIGDKNTNCVIAGHRGGYNGEQLFKNIEQLEIGDEIEITNAWETLVYVVNKKIVIESDDIEAIKIIPNQDMITLFTCHPYGYETHRYVVYAQREEDQKQVQLPDGIEYESSTKDIIRENLLRKIAFIISVVFTLALVALRIKERKEQ